MGKNLKNFVGEYAYNIIKNSAVDGEKLRSALVTPQNARNVFSELTEFEVKSLCTEICNSGEIGVIRKTNQAEITEAFKTGSETRKNIIEQGKQSAHLTTCPAGCANIICWLPSKRILTALNMLTIRHVMTNTEQAY